MKVVPSVLAARRAPRPSPPYRPRSWTASFSLGSRSRPTRRRWGRASAAPTVRHAASSATTRGCGSTVGASCTRRCSWAGSRSTSGTGCRCSGSGVRDAAGRGRCCRRSSTRTETSRRTSARARCSPTSPIPTRATAAWPPASPARTSRCGCGCRGWPRSSRRVRSSPRRRVWIRSARPSTSFLVPCPMRGGRAARGSDGASSCARSKASSRWRALHVLRRFRLRTRARCAGG